MIRPEGLARLIANENSMSDLWVMLSDLDPAPLSAILGLPDGEALTIWREPRIKGHGRLDILINGADGLPVAALEMKGASGIHGDQLERYSAWAGTFDKRPRLYLCAFDEDESDDARAWTRLRLRTIFLPWTHSRHPYAAGLAAEVVRTLDKWDGEADGDLGTRTGYYVPDIVTKRMARHLQPEMIDRFGPDSRSVPFRDMAGNPMIIAATDHPRDASGLEVRIGVDLRMHTRTSLGNWTFRPYIEVLDDSDLPKARQEAFRVARSLRQSMAASGLVQELAKRGLTQLSSHLDGGKHDGFRRSVADFDFEDWAARIVGLEGKYPSSGVFGYDRGTRLSTILNLDIAGLTRTDVQNLMIETVSVLADAAERE